MIRTFASSMLAALAVLATLGVANATPNTGTGPTQKPAATKASCTVTMVPKWECRGGDKPGDIFKAGNSCKIVMVRQTVCKQ